MRADILLLDEPTNHLDVANVAWLEQYLVSRPDVSSMIVSHDSGARPLLAGCQLLSAGLAIPGRRLRCMATESGPKRLPTIHATLQNRLPRALFCCAAGFLDNVCTDIIHYENKQLVLYPGNLSAFVQVRAPPSGLLCAASCCRPTGLPVPARCASHSWEGSTLSLSGEPAQVATVGWQQTRPLCGYIGEARGAHVLRAAGRHAEVHLPAAGLPGGHQDEEPAHRHHD